MTKEEAIEMLRNNVCNSHHVYDNDLLTIKEALKVLIPELRESEDERISKIIRLALIASEDELSAFYRTHGITRKECTDWLEKATETIKRIDEFIDDHTANAHDMKDTNPNKMYYRGWDDVLTEMSRILEDVYYGSGEKQKDTIQDKVEQRMEYLWDKLPDARRVEEGNCTPEEWKALGAYMELEMNFDKGSEEKQKEKKPEHFELKAGK